jgi:hypothetical protein
MSGRQGGLGLPHEFKLDEWLITDVANHQQSTFLALLLQSFHTGYDFRASKCRVGSRCTHDVALCGNVAYQERTIYAISSVLS